MIDRNAVSFRFNRAANWNITWFWKLMACGSIIIQMVSRNGWATFIEPMYLLMPQSKRYTNFKFPPDMSIVTIWNLRSSDSVRLWKYFWFGFSLWFCVRKPFATMLIQFSVENAFESKKSIHLSFALTFSRLCLFRSFIHYSDTHCMCRNAIGSSPIKENQCRIHIFWYKLCVCLCARCVWMFKRMLIKCEIEREKVWYCIISGLVNGFHVKYID